MDVDVEKWSRDGDLTQQLLDLLQGIPGIAAVRVEDAQSSRSDSSFLFLSNEIYVRFVERDRVVRTRWLGVIPARRRIREPAFTLADLEAHLAREEAIGEADYRDEGMLQYLRAERIIPPYQTRGYKLIEMVRIYEVRGADAGSRKREAGKA